MKKNSLLIFTLCAFAAQAQITPATFFKNASFVAGEMPVGIDHGDFDGDGKQDLVVTNYYAGFPERGNAISVYRNQFTPGVLDANTYAPKVDFTIAGSPQDVVSRDIDGDGKPDLVVANYIYPGVVSVLRNTAVPGVIDANSFAEKIDLLTVLNVSNVSVGDLDGDGKADVIAGTDYGISIFKNNSTIGTIDLTNSLNYEGIEPIVDLALGDIDGDGKLDMVSISLQSDSISIWRNISNSNTIAFEPRVKIATGRRPSRLAVGDLDGDGKSDVVTGYYSSNVLNVYKNNTSGPGPLTNSCLIKNTPNIAVRSGVYSIVLNDLDLDGKTEIIIGRQNLGISVFKNNSTMGVFSFENEVNYQYPYAGTTEVTSFDYDNDGRPDLAATNYSTQNGRLSVLKNEPSVIPDFTVNVNNSVCPGVTDGSITINVTAGEPPFQYSINGGATYQTENTFNGLSPGDYNVVVKNRLITSPVKVITLKQPVDTIPPVISCSGDVTVIANSCNAIVGYDIPVGTDNCPGAITALTEGFITGSEFPVGETNVTYEVTDVSGNKASCSFKVIVKSGLEASVSATRYPGGFNISCHGKSDGEAVATASNGCAPYTYEWNTTPVQTTSTATHLSAGTYTVKITDASGNSVEQTVQLTQPPVLNINTSGNATVYYGYAPKACTLLSAGANGGTPGYSYLWSNGSTSASTSVCPESNTNYTVTVTDANGCKAVSAPVSVCVVDVRCGNNKVSVCHGTKTMCLPAAAIAAHLGHGDKLGTCGSNQTCNSLYGKAETISEETDGSTALVYPNPFSSNATLEFRSTGSERITVDVYSAQGIWVAKVFDAVTEQGIVYHADIDGAKWAKGLYIVRIVSANKIQNLKLVLAE